MKEKLSRAVGTPETIVLTVGAAAMLLLARDGLSAALLLGCAVGLCLLRWLRPASRLPVPRGLDDLMGKAVWLAFCTAVALTAILMIMEKTVVAMLPSVLTLMLALMPSGARELMQSAAQHTEKRMAQNGLRMKAPALTEPLARTSVLLVDQEDWLTAPAQVTMVAAPLNPVETARFRRQNSAVLLATAMALLEDTNASDGAAQAAFAAAMGYEGLRLRARMPQVGAVAAGRDGVRSAAFREGTGLRLFLTGETEAVLARCTKVADGAERALAPEERAELLRQAEEARSRGMRPTAYAMQTAEGASAEARQAVLLGVVYVEEKPLFDVEDALKDCVRAGIRPVVFTRGSREAATLTARRLGLLTPGERVVDGADLARMDDERLREEVRDIVACAGADAAQRRRVTAAWHAWDAVVLTTDESCEDADLTAGNGTSASLQMAAPSFTALTSAIALARRMRRNQTNALQYLGVCMLSGAAAVLAAAFVGMPLTVVSVLLFLLLTRGFAVLPLLRGGDLRGVMRKPPQDADAAVTDAPMIFRVVLQSVCVTACTSAALGFGNLAAFLTLGVACALLVPANVSAVRTAFRRSARRAWARAGLSVLVTAVLTAGMSAAGLGQAPSSLVGWGAAIGPGIVPLLMTEVFKAVGWTGEKLRLIERKCK